MSRRIPAGSAGLTIDGLAFAREGSRLSGRIEGKSLQRLAEMQCIAEALEFALAGGLNELGKPALSLQVEGDVRLTCQRCLKPLQHHLVADVELELASSQEQAEATEDEMDRVVASRSMSVAEMVEDEAILALPMIPRHERCTAVEGLPDKPGRPSPFDVLKTLKGR